MRAWKHKTTGEIYNDIQDIPNPLPSGYNAEEWELTDITETELTALSRHAAQVAYYKTDTSGVLYSGEFEIQLHDDLEVRL